MNRWIGTVLLCVAGVGAGFGQAAASGAAANGSTVSILQPSMQTIESTLTTLQPDKWKLSSAIKGLTGADIASIKRDVDGTLPQLASAADAAPNSMAASLTVANNVNALYDVLLRVAEKAQLAAPDAQTTALGQALQGLEDARKQLNARMLANATAQDKQMRDMRANLRTQTDAASAATAQVATLQAAKTAPCAPAKPAVKKTVTRKPVAKTAKPATTAPATTSPAKPSGF